MAAKHLLGLGLFLCSSCAQRSADVPLYTTTSTTAPTTTSTAATTTTTSPPRTLSVVAVGDWLSEGLINNAAAAAAAAEGSTARFDNVPLIEPFLPLIQGADLAICHMETPIGLPGGKAGFIGLSEYESAIINAPYEVAGDLRRAGFDRCSTASNHALDSGENGIGQTLDALDAAGVGHSGTARTPQEAYSPPFEANGVKVTHLSYTRSSNVGWSSHAWAVNRAEAALMIADIERARADGAEIVIVSMHVDQELEKAPTLTDRSIVETVAAAAHPDLIVITGPHVVQPVERVGSTLVFWSLGNFISGMGMPDRGKYAEQRTLDGVMAQVQFAEQPGGSWTSEYTPIAVCNTKGGRVVYPAGRALQDTSIPDTLRAQLEACFNRTSAVVAGVQ